ncbi:MAG: ribonucleoside triphosphate reductase [Candidatus Aenigmarchaeota archaeon]|nr:ribonucleoside triphosphate reductase [Candidatus Aenigmarchaeota archaeon]
MGLEKIKKRDDRIVKFDNDKIKNAIMKAVKAVGGKDEKSAEQLATQVITLLKRKFRDQIPSVEDVQDMVEKVLIENGHAKTAKAFILYREQRAAVRDVKKLLSDTEIVDDYLKETDWQVRENSNMSYSLQGLNSHLSSQIISNYWMSKLYPREIQEAHRTGDFHIHDLGVLGAYCVGWDLRDLLISGFKGVRGKIECRPPKHFRVALGQIVNFFYTLQGEAAGAQAFSNFDTYLSPFIRADNLDFKQVKQTLQEFIFNINVPTRVGFQTPFTNITLDLIVPANIKDDAVIIGGKMTETTYGDYQKEMDVFNEAFAEVMMEGDASGRVFTFPIPTYNITKDFDWDSPKYKGIWEMTAKYGIPYFSNFINSDMKPEDARSMCCRLRLDNRELRKRGGGLFGANPLTGSIGVVTINMPRLGFLSRNEKEFFARLDSLMDLAKESLEIKRKIIESFTDKGLYPYSKFYLRATKDATGSYWTNHFSTIGLVGLNEAVMNFMDANIADENARKFAIKVLEYMRERISGYQEATGHIYNLEATPGEGTSHRLARLDKKLHPEIVVANEYNVRKFGAAPYYTNSSQLPVNYTDDIFTALDLQEELQTKYTGGTVLHGFVGERMPSPEATKMLVKKIAENYKIPYFTITPTFSICPKHGYLAGEHKFCPKCDEEIGYVKKPVAASEPVRAVAEVK